MSRTSTRKTDRRARLGVQTLEAREVPAILIGDTVRPPLPQAPDYAGGTPETARVMTLPAMQVRTATDYLPSSADVDMYQLTLKQGDFFVADIDPTSSAALDSTVQLLDAAGNQIAAATAPAGRPTIELFGHTGSLGAYAPADGTYYVKVTTAATTADVRRGYNLSLERIALDDSNMAAAPLQASGPYHAWLNASGDTLNVTGPTGYGFSLRGTWTKSVSGSDVTYAATGTLYLRTPFLAQSAGEIALRVARGQTFRVSTHTAGPVQAGELTGVSGHFGLSLAPVADQVRRVFGLDVSQIALADGWTIKTGAQIKHDYQSYIQHNIAQLLDGVPYLVYGQAGKVKLQFGQVSVTSTDQAKTVLIADPADPFLYVGYKNYAAAGSLNGHIPFHATVAPSDPTSPARGGTEFFGQVYAAGSFPIAGLPVSVNGDVTVDLDTDRDGMYLGGSGNASQLFRGDLNAIEPVLKDINVGINGGVNLGYTVAGRTITVPLGQASALYSGPQQGVWVKGVQGTAVNPWRGTVLENFQSGPGATVEGYAYRDGRFSVATTANFRVFVANAALTVTVTDHDIGAQGTITTPIGKADVTGSIGFDGNFRWTADGHIDVGGGGNYLRGDAMLTIEKAGSTFSVTGVLTADAKLSIPGFKAEGKVTGILRVVRHSDGTVGYSGDLRFVGGVYSWNPVTQDWNKLGGVDVELQLIGRRVILRAFGQTFAVTL